MSASNTASKVNVTRGASQQPRLIQQADTAILAAIGVTERGPVDMLTLHVDVDDWKATYGGYTLNNLATLAAVEAWFSGGGGTLWFVRTLHHTTPGDPTTKTSTGATLNLSSASSSPTAGSVTSSNTAPFVLAHGDTIIVDIDGGGNTTATISATAASRLSANSAPFALADNDTLTVSIDGATAAVVTFVTGAFVDIAAATAAEVCAAINARFATLGIAAVATVSTAAVLITSSKKGTDSGVNITAGSAQGVGKLNFTAGNTAGTGNVASVAAVTVAELKLIIETAETDCTVTDVGGAVKIASETTGTGSTVQVIASSTADDELGFDNAVHTGTTGAAVTVLTLDAEDGEYANTVTTTVAAATNGDTANYVDFKLLQGGIVKDTFENVSMDSTNPRYILTVVNDNNTLGITLTDLETGLLPATGTFGPMTGGDDGLTSLADSDFSGGVTANGKTGLRVFDGTDEATILICPQRATAAVATALNTYANVTRAKRMFVIHDPPASLTAAGMATYAQTTAALTESVEVAAAYWPRIKIASPDETLYGSDLVVVPPSGHIAAAYSRTDSTKQIGGAFVSPGGTDIGLVGMLGLETDEVMDINQRNLLTAVLVNPISKERGTGFFLDGVLTLLSTGPFPAIGQSRGVMSVANSLELGLRFARQKNNTPALRQACADLATLFLTQITSSGVLASSKPSEAFQVDFGPGRNKPSDQRNRAVNGAVGLAVAEPAVFVNVVIFPDTRAAQAELAAA